LTIFYLIRHPESDFNLNHSHKVGGRSNYTPVTETGLIQTEKLAKRLQSEKIKFDGWFASPAVRTMKGAEITRDFLDPTAEIIIDDRLQELHQGDWEGRLRSETFTPEIAKIAFETHPYFRAPNGESQFEKAENMYEFIGELLNDEPKRIYAIFSHGVAIKCLLQKILDSKSQMTINIGIENTSITVVRYEKGQWFVDRVNDHAHLTWL
jgi:broad specificity phosphatase PhoE